MKKNLVIVIGELAVGGAENMICELINHIDFTKYVVTVLCYGVKKCTYIEGRIENLCKVVYMDISGRISFCDMCKVFKKLSSLKPNVLHAHLGGITFALPWARLHRKPIVITAHTKPEKAFSKRNEKQLRAGLKKDFIKLVAVSEENHIACKEYFGIGDDKCLCINNGIDVKRFYRDEHEGFVFINLARQDENKNQALLLKCFKRLYDEHSDVRLILAGDGPCHKSLIELAESLEISEFVEFPGMVSDAEKYYARSDVYVQSSYREAMPLSVLEAMAVGLPVISTDVGGLKDVVKENGILTKAGSEEELYAAMKKIYAADDALLNKYKAESLELVKAYSADNMADEYSKLYDSLIK